ncbi:hypothetical protein PTKIN_Ptkin18bG0091000 [Pterospermum kingtungense]
MLEHETVNQFHYRLKKIVNDSFALGKIYSTPNLVQNVLRSFLDRFRMKVATMEEAKNLETLPLDELMGNLETFEANLKRRKDKNSLAFKANHDPATNNEDIRKTLAQLTKNLGKVIERLDYRSRRSSRG